MNEYLPEGSIIEREENRAACAGREGLERAMFDGSILEAKAAMCDGDMRLHFHLGEIEGIMPPEEVLVTENGEPVRDIAVITRVGKPCAFAVLDLTEVDGRPVALLSRRAAQEKCLREKLDKLLIGDILEAKVQHFEPFGAFCDIGCGISSLLSIDSISVSRISHPSDRFFIGEKILCAVKSRDEVLLGSRGRIALTHKELLGTWTQNAARFSAGQTVVGVVRSVESYGVFIELAPNLAGLSEYRSDVKAGEACSVYIKSILPEKHKVKLVLIDTLGKAAERTLPEYFIREGNVADFRYAD